MEDRRPSIVDNILIGVPEKVKTDGIAKILLNSLAKSSDSIAQINTDTKEKVSFGELKYRSIRCALWLRKQGIGENDVICISTPNQANDSIPVLASLYIGATVTPWYHELPLATTEHFFSLTKPKVIFACKKSIDRLVQVAKNLGSDCKFVTYERFQEYTCLNDIIKEQSDEEVYSFEHNEPEDPSKQIAVIIFSSGTTGTPKGTMLPYHCLTNHRYEVAGISEGMHVLWYSALSWLTGFNFLIHCIEIGATRILHPTFDPAETYQVIKDFEVNFLFLAPIFLARMFEKNQNDVPSLQRVFTGGARSAAAVLERVRKNLLNVFVGNSYGMTEVGGAVAGQTTGCKKNDSVGYIYKNVCLKIVDPKNCKILGANKEGEICFKVDHMMIGYIDSPEETKKVIDSEGWVHSGDLGFYDETGELSVTDRMKEMIFYQNQRIPPSQIENILMQHPDVVSASVVPVPHRKDIERIFAFVKKSSAAKVTAEELMKLPVKFDENFRVTGGLVFVDDFPLNSSGKIDIQELKKRAIVHACE
ncbi:hypothetical protein QAD02_022960 [Eretmocerus hayati]|uniref:Uncharacterized protein n=1 Tax=Eretmocerus hayati TaxID=131215 RepID=A0ACC2PW50_9HYME|nr:hypothetical protein QAD02_022960 [Eretmocerus hayati]